VFLNGAFSCPSKSKICYDRQSVGQSVLVSSTHLGLMTRFLLLLRVCSCGASFWRENGSAIYNCCWSSPALSFLGLSPTGLVTIFYCLRIETPPTWRARFPYLYPPGTGWPSYTPRHWVPFSLPLWALHYITSAPTIQETPFLTVPLLQCWLSVGMMYLLSCGNAVNLPLSSSGQCLSYHVTILYATGS
jgi:hypothetical protein